MVQYSVYLYFPDLGYMYIENTRNSSGLPNRIALGLLLGGDLGNLIDRLRFSGPCYRFINPGFFYVFNVADAAITIGVILIIFSVLRETIRENKYGLL